MTFAHMSIAPIAATLTTAQQASNNVFHQSLVIAELNISVWTGRKLDKQATQEVTTANNASPTVGAFHKKLLGDCAELVAIQKHAANVRNWHYEQTSLWGDLGQRTLPTSRFPMYYEGITGHQAEFDKLKEVFLSTYDHFCTWAQTEARAKLGSLYRESDYPSVDTLRTKFAFSHSQQPMPVSGHWQLDMLNEHNQILAQSFADTYNARLDATMREVWQRTYDAMSKMSERLDYVGGDAKDKKVFRDSLVYNLRDLLTLLDAFNVEGDHRMTAMRDGLEAALDGVSPDALREDDHLRRDTKQKVDAILSTLSW
jgi:hypothetical protein